MLPGPRPGVRVGSIALTAEETLMVRLRVHGRERPFDGDLSMLLLWYFRDELALTETKYGCGAALCDCPARLGIAVHRTS